MIVYNRFIPPGRFSAMAVFPFIFVKGSSISEKSARHEKIHFKQQKELLIVFFYLLYLVFWLIYGYKNSPFEREARENSLNVNYLNQRKKFAWCRYLRNK